MHRCMYTVDKYVYIFIHIYICIYVYVYMYVYIYIYIISILYKCPLAGMHPPSTMIAFHMPTSWGSETAWGRVFKDDFQQTSNI